MTKTDQHKPENANTYNFVTYIRMYIPVVLLTQTDRQQQHQQHARRVGPNSEEWQILAS